MKKQPAVAIPSERIEQAILLVRGEKVMLDADLAALYGVETRVLKQAIRRNPTRFPKDFMFELTWEEAQKIQTLRVASVQDGGSGLRSQSVILKRGQHVKHLPFVFTEQGIAMLSSVLHSPRAVAVNIEIMRAFVRLRQLLATHADLARRINEMESKFDKQFAVVFDAIRKLIKPPEEPPREMGYHTLMPKKK